MEQAKEPVDARSSGSLRGMLILAPVMILIGIGLIGWALRPISPLMELERAALKPYLDPFVGANACRECHLGEHAAHGGSGHARTLHRASSLTLTQWLDGRKEPDPEMPGVVWDYTIKDDRMTATRSDGQNTDQFDLEFAIGSGKHAITFVGFEGEGPGPRGGLEHRMTYFSHSKAMGVTPGQTAPNEEPGLAPEGFHLPPNVVLDCISCHATRTSVLNPRVLDLKSMIPNVSCERCHGPGRAHIEAARRSAPPSELVMTFTGRTDAESEVRMCGRCHRLPEMVPPETIRPEVPSLARFPSVGLMKSGCYEKAKGEIRCTTCHDPHARTSTDQRSYERTCVNCHTAPAQRRCTVNAQDRCVGCHMPKRDVGHGLMFTDHWIHKTPPK